MNLKRLLMLSSLALAAMAFAVPAMASAEQKTFTHNHKHLEPSEAVTQHFKGDLAFEVVPIASTFGCEFAVSIATEGPTTARITNFQPTTESCAGTGAFAGCELVDHTFNTPWQVDVITDDLLVTNPGDHIEIHNFYEEACGVGQTTQTLFEDITVNPVLNGEGTIIALRIAETTNVDTSGLVRYTGEFGLHVPSSPTLGLT